MNRPQLAAVLAHLTDTEEWRWPDTTRFPHATVRFSENAVCVYEPMRQRSSTGIAKEFPLTPLVPLTVASVAEAWERLQTRGVIPLDYAGRFVPKGVRPSDVYSDGTLFGFGAVDRRDEPLPLLVADLPLLPESLPDLVAWCSLGWDVVCDEQGAMVAPGIRGLEEWATRRHPARAVVWRVAPVTDDDIGGSFPAPLLASGVAPLCLKHGPVHLTVPPLTPPNGTR